MHGLIAGTRNGHLSARPSGAWVLGFELAPNPGLAAALCKGIEPELFFPERGDRRTAALAREICAQCPVAAACLADALAIEGSAGHAMRFGIRGGTTPEERYTIHRRSRKATAASRAAAPLPSSVDAAKGAAA
ncbi:WhiB family transcriptional regulator [Streptomyces lunaelactis]|uniref:WhiB family transcriptional regulator n=1 Tax=Streptomyces lunaelactis TaxID=1535768 RepID=UPI001585CEBC|nr:WhiB family transcriptional regulator [Streptomyces lunaelactis]NUK71097.1 WhiB family transcriptional regulator [Streptomyces lunaelactis]NUK79691.1 WhiB family transcriptional regulator [Streptomyces lunaelactis]